MYIPRFRRAKVWYTQLEVSTQIGDISNLMEQRLRALDLGRMEQASEIDNQIEIAQYVLTRMLEKNETKLKREV